MRAHTRWLSAIALLATSAGAAQAQEITNYVPSGEIARDGTIEEGGWDGALSLSATFNLASNSNVVGQVDGESFLAGGTLRGGIDYVRGAHEWRNTLGLQQSWAQTPVIDEWIKNNDVFDVESVYHYYLTNWLGAFGRFNLQTALFEAEQVTADPAVYAPVGADGAVQRDEDGNLVGAVTTSRLALSKAFEPLTFNESVGLFATPIRSKPLDVKFRVGIGGRHTFADNVRVLGDVAATPDVIEFKTLNDVHQAGVELFLGAEGLLYGKRLSYSAGGSVLLPFINNDPLERDVGELTKIALHASLVTSVFDWMSLNYELKAVNDPQLIDEWQLQNSLLVSFNYTLIERDRTAAPADPLQEKLKAAEAKAAEAEARAKAAEERAQAVEKANAEKAAAEEAAAEEAAAEEAPATPAPAPEGAGTP